MKTSPKCVQREIFTSQVSKLGMKFQTTFENESRSLALKDILESIFWTFKG